MIWNGANLQKFRGKGTIYKFEFQDSARNFIFAKTILSRLCKKE
jgi:hypothetical protein